MDEDYTSAEESVTKYQKVGDIEVEYLLYDPKAYVLPQKYMQTIITGIAMELNIDMHEIKKVQTRCWSEEELEWIYGKLKGNAVVPDGVPEDLLKRGEIAIAIVYTAVKTFKIAFIHIFSVPVFMSHLFLPMPD